MGLLDLFRPKPDGDAIDALRREILRSDFAEWVPVAASGDRLEIMAAARAGRTGPFTEAVHASPGEIIAISVGVRNAGITAVYDVLVRVVLPPGTRYVPGSSLWISGHTANRWHPPANDAVTEGGLLLGSYTPGGAAYVQLLVELPRTLPCGRNTFVLQSSVGGRGWKFLATTSANVIVLAQC